MWKKNLLRAKGALIVEHSGDYGQAVAQGRREAESDPRAHFGDDENLVTLFLGYTATALGLQKQLASENIPVGHDHPAVRFSSLRVGGAPGGFTFGLRVMTFGRTGGLR